MRYAFLLTAVMSHQMHCLRRWPRPGPSRAMDRVQAWHDGLGLAWGSHLLGAVLGEVLHRTVYSDIPSTTTAYALQGHMLRYAEAWKACANTRSAFARSAF